MEILDSLPDLNLHFDDFVSDLTRYSDELQKSPYFRNDTSGIVFRKVLLAYANKGLLRLISPATVSFLYHKDESVVLFTDTLMTACLYSMVKRYWRSYLARCKSNFWNEYKYIEANKLPNNVEVTPFLSERQCDELNQKWVNEEWPTIKGISLDAYRIYRNIAKEMDDPIELSRIEDDLHAMETYQRPMPKKKRPDSTKIDDIVFWEFIEKARQDMDASEDELLTNLTEHIEDLKAGEIKQFHKLLLDILDELYTWDVMALAYIAQGGCSDNSFLEFRCWVILQGKQVFDLCKSDIESAMHFVPKDGNNYCENLLYVADQAYEVRSGGKTMTVSSRKDNDPKGVEWDEDKVEELYPMIAGYYAEK